MKLVNKTIVLTGGSSGVGLDLLSRLIRCNTVINLSRRKPIVEQCDRYHALHHVATDLSDTASVSSAILSIHDRFPNGMDGLINCAAVQYQPAFAEEEFEPASIAREVAVNFTSPAELISGLLAGMLRRPEGFILNVNSGLAIVPKQESAVYCATKSALDNLTQGLRAQLVASDIRVQQTFLPLVDTPMTEGRGSAKVSAGKVADAIIRQIENGTRDLDIGKVKFLRAIHRFSPALARQIMQKG